MLNKRIVNFAKFSDASFPAYYRKETSNMIKKSKKIQNTNLIKKVASTIFEIIAEDVVDNKAGVYLQKLGYFFVWRTPKVVTMPAKYGVPEPNIHSNGRQYFLHFSPETTTNKNVLGWTMSRTFSANVKHRLSKNLKKGWKYKNYYSVFKKVKKDGL